MAWRRRTSSDLLSFGTGPAVSVAVEVHGEHGENVDGLLVVAGMLLLALGAAVDRTRGLL